METAALGCNLVEVPDSPTNKIDLDDAQFATPPLDQWTEIAEASLGGQSAASLTTTTYDGIERKALYTAHDRFSTRSDFRRGRVVGAADTSWDIRPIHDASHPDVNSRILADLEGGATSIHLLNAPNHVDHLKDVLAGVQLGMAGIYLDDRAAADALVELWTRCNAVESATGCLGVDPIGALAITGGLAAPVDDALKAVVMAASVSEHLPNVTAARADGRPYGEAGASDSTEIACVLSTATAYLRVLTESGRSIDLSTLNLSFTLTVGPDQFLSIAKLRAARICWAALVSACGGSHRHMPIHATTAEWAVSKRDPWVNMLRATTAAFAAAVGGAEAISILPFDSAIGHPDELGLRIARNTNFLLGQEAGLDGVTDPGGGSYYLETLTEDIASAAWSKFQDLEARGGIAAALNDGSLQREIALTRAEREEAIANRSDPLTGVSEYATTELTRLERLPRTEAPELIADVVDTAPVGRFRAAAPYEELRDAADQHVAATGLSPTIFSANLGPAATYTARNAFVANLFAAGGIELSANEGFTSPEGAADAFKKSGLSTAVVCSSDEMYDEFGTRTVAALKSAGATYVWLAGKPPNSADALEAAGVDEFVGVGGPALATLRNAHSHLEVAQ